ncbi:MAG: alpha/beta hydrolase [Candidatus Cloacimonetes bacterium]|nr:alpha/beta hydrolase [Candidatus Cloacimonadota bacterium]
MDALQDESFLWFPGWGGNAYGLLPIVEQLPYGLHYLVDPKSTDLDNLSIETWVEEVFSKIPNNKKWNVIGFSMGGLLAQEFVNKYSNHVKSLHLVCTNTGAKDNPGAINSETLKRWFSSAPELSDPLERVLQPCFSQKSLDDGTYLNYLQYLKADHNPVSPKIPRAQHTVVLQYNTRHFVSSIQTPTFIYVGQEDQVVPRAASLELLNSIHGSVLHEIEGGHFCMLESFEQFEGLLTKSLLSL